MASTLGQSPEHVYARGSASLYLVCDLTGSSFHHIEALQSTLSQVSTVSRLFFGDDAEHHLVTFEDSGSSEVTNVCTGNIEELRQFASRLSPLWVGYSEWPKASKSALNRVLSIVDAKMESSLGEACLPPQPIVFLFIDAPPHHVMFGSNPSSLEAESEALASSPGGDDWIDICRAFRKRSIPVHTFSVCPCEVADMLRFEHGKYMYALLGPVIVLRRGEPDLITRATTRVLLSLFGEPFVASPSDFRILAVPPIATSATSEPSHVGHMAPMTPASLTATYESPLPENEDGCTLIAFATVHPLEDMTGSSCRLPVVSGLPGLLRALPERLRAELALWDLALELLAEMLVPANVAALSYNAVVGTLWRLWCSEGGGDPRLAKLGERLKSCVWTLPQNELADLREWHERSGDPTGFVSQAIRAAEELAKSTSWEAGVLPVEGVRYFEPSYRISRRMRVRGGGWISQKDWVVLNPRLSKVGWQLLLGNRMVLEVWEGEEDLVVGCGRGELCVMKVYPGSRGRLLTRQPLAVMAVMTWQSGNICLQGRAARLLRSMRGRWICLDIWEEEFMSPDTVRLLAPALSEDFFTEEEIRVYSRAYTIDRLRRAAPKEFSIRVPFTPDKSEVWADDKRECTKCHHMRSLTLLEGSVCAMCLHVKDDAPPTPPDPSDCAPAQSHLVQCKTCTSIYALTSPQNLLGSPKCYYCRTYKSPPPHRHMHNL